MGVPIAADLAATLLCRGLRYWLPMASGIPCASRDEEWMAGLVHRGSRALKMNR